MEKLVIDLRNNPGGVLDTAVEMLAYVLPEDKLDGMLVYTADKNGEGDRYFCKDGKIQRESDDGSRDSRYPKEDDHELDVPLAVLVMAILPALPRYLPVQSWIMMRELWLEPLRLAKVLSRI